MKTDGTASQFLTFSLDDEVFGFPVHSVQEVLEYKKITRLPQMPSWVYGVINVRDRVIPVLSLREKFNLPAASSLEGTNIIIVEIQRPDGISVFGILVDSVSEVIEMPADTIEPPPRVGFSIDSRFIEGLGKRDEAFIILLNIGFILSDKELSQIDGISGEESSMTE